MPLTVSFSNGDAHGNSSESIAEHEWGISVSVTIEHDLEVAMRLG